MQVRAHFLFLVMALLLASSAQAGVLVFPPTSANNTQCSTDNVPNNCGVVVFSGGHFVTNNGTTTYMGGQNFPTCVSGQVGWTFMNGPATALDLVIENDAYKSERRAGRQSVANVRVCKWAIERHPRRGRIDHRAS